jgi:hypothetical protein
MDSLKNRITRSIAQRGLIGTAQMCWTSFWMLVLPAARRAEARRQEADAEFDRRFGVNTGGTVRPEPKSVRGANWLFGISYEGVDPDAAFEAINRLDIPHSEFTFIDFGSGKGRVLLIASQLPFKKIIGVEYCEELNTVARQNLVRHPAADRRCNDIEVVTADATECAIPDGPLVLFFFNPFGEPVMAGVVRNVMESLRKQPRRVIVIYFTPYFAGLWEDTGLFQRIESTPAILDTEGARAAKGSARDASAVHPG